MIKLVVTVYLFIRMVLVMKDNLIIFSYVGRVAFKVQMVTVTLVNGCITSIMAMEKRY